MTWVRKGYVPPSVVPSYVPPPVVPGYVPPHNHEKNRASDSEASAIHTLVRSLALLHCVSFLLNFELVVTSFPLLYT